MLRFNSNKGSTPLALVEAQVALFEVKCGVRPSFMHSLKSLFSNANCVNRPALRLCGRKTPS